MPIVPNRRTILSKISCCFLNFQKGEGYYFFTYTNRDVLETETVHVDKLNALTIIQWIEIGQRLVLKCEKMEKSRAKASV